MVVVTPLHGRAPLWHLWFSLPSLLDLAAQPCLARGVCGGVSSCEPQNFLSKGDNVPISLLKKPSPKYQDTEG